MGTTGSSARVFLSVNVEGLDIITLADSGADVSLIALNTLNSLNVGRESPIRIDSDHSIFLKPLGHGPNIRSLGTVCLDIRIDEYVAANAEFYVVEDSVTSHDMIFGADFLYKYCLAPSPAHHRLIYWPVGTSHPVFVGKPATFEKPVCLNFPLTLKSNSVCFVEIPKPNITWHEAMYEPNLELLERHVAFSRSLIPLDKDTILLEVVCLSPIDVVLKRDLFIGTLQKTEEFDSPPDS